MKRALIGGFISLLGTIWGLAIAVAASNNLVSGWTTPPGRFLSTVSQMGFVPLFVMAIVLVVLGLVIMAIEYFKKTIGKYRSPLMSGKLIRGDLYGEQSVIICLSAQQYRVALKRAAGYLREHLYKLVL